MRKLSLLEFHRKASPTGRGPKVEHDEASAKIKLESKLTQPDEMDCAYSSQLLLDMGTVFKPSKTHG